MSQRWTGFHRLTFRVRPCSFDRKRRGVTGQPSTRQSLTPGLFAAGCSALNNKKKKIYSPLPQWPLRRLDMLHQRPSRDPKSDAVGAKSSFPNRIHSRKPEATVEQPSADFLARAADSDRFTAAFGSRLLNSFYK